MTPIQEFMLGFSFGTSCTIVVALWIYVFLIKK